MKDGLTGRIRNCISGFSSRKTFSASAVAKIIGEPNAMMVQQAFADLMERGEITKRAPGRYSYKGIPKLWKKPSPITSRIFRAMHVSRAFSARDIALLADATKNFVHKLIRELTESGEIVAASRQKNVNGQSEMTHRIKSRDGFYLKHLIGGNNGKNN